MFHRAKQGRSGCPEKTWSSKISSAITNACKLGRGSGIEVLCEVVVASCFPTHANGISNLRSFKKYLPSESARVHGAEILSPKNEISQKKGDSRVPREVNEIRNYSRPRERKLRLSPSTPVLNFLLMNFRQGENAKYLLYLILISNDRMVDRLSWLHERARCTNESNSPAVHQSLSDIALEKFMISE